eukprot:gene9642-10629_t
MASAATTALSFQRLDHSKFEEALRIVCAFFGVDSLLPDQVTALRAFFSGNDIYFSAPTGFGKSLIFQCMPMIADILNENLIGTCKALVICPLKALMLDQVEKMKETAVTAAAIYDGQDEQVLQEIENGDYSLVFASPESVLATDRWRKLLTSTTYFQKNCRILVIDEAHCIVHWGASDSGTSEVPFRKWYGHLLELKALLHEPRLAIFTATASKTTKRRIFELLHISYLNTALFEKNPNKDNIRYAVQYISNKLTLTEIFSEIIANTKKYGKDTEGTLIFCNTRKQCSLIFRSFCLSLGNSIFDGNSNPKNRMVEMFHAGSPETVKDHIRKTVTSPDGHIRVLICTIAFGMGIDCKYMTRVVHFGGSRCMETYLQECGRAGRNGLLSTCYLLHNGILLRHSGEDIKNYVTSSECRRKEISSIFPCSNPTAILPKGCLCCDICAESCNCGKQSCKFGLTFSTLSVPSYIPARSRKVEPCHKKSLYAKLESYSQCLLPENLDKCTPVSYGNILLEFGNTQIQQVLENCDRIFSFEDVKSLVEIWRDVHANNILIAVYETFNDFILESSDLVLFDADSEDEIDSEWIYIRDDSLPTNYNVTSYLQNTCHSSDMSIDATEDTLDTSAEIEQMMPNLSVSQN